MEKPTKSKSKNQNSVQLLLFTKYHARNPAPQNNPNGFILVSTLSLLPLLVGLFLAVSAIIWWLQSKAELQFKCEDTVLALQKTITETENQLLQLNPRAESLILQKKILQSAIKVAHHPAAKATLLLKLKHVLLQMAQHRSLQMITYQKGERYAQLFAQKRYFDMQKSTQKVISIWSSPLYAKIQLTPPTIQLSTFFKDPLLPIYVVPAQFIQLQKFQLRIAISGRSLFPRWIQFLVGKNIYWQESCSSIPQKEGMLWKPQIAKDKFL